MSFARFRIPKRVAHKCFGVRQFVETAFALGVLLGMLSCGGAQGSPSANLNNSSSDPSGNATGNVTGVTNTIYVNSNGTQVIPQDLSSTTIAAYIPNGSGGFTKITGTGTANGTFTVPLVPNGKYWLQEGNNFFWTDVSAIDTLDFNVNRPPTSTQQNSNCCTWYVPNLGVSRLYSLNETGPGAWSGTGPWLNNSSLTAPLMDAGGGDAGYLLVYPGGALSSPFVTAQEFGGPVSVTMTDGGITTVNGTTNAIVASKSFRANIQGSAFQSLQPLVHPSATPFDEGGQSGIAVKVQPFTTQYGALVTYPVFLMSNPSLISASMNVMSANTDYGDIAYGDPFPAGFTEYVQYLDSVALGVDFGMSLLGEIGGVTTSIPSATQPVTPMLGPVVSPTIDGSDYHTALLASTTPTLAWKPPSVGTAQYYAVYFGAKSTTAEGNPTIVNPMWFYTADTSITIPPGVLSFGNGYVSLIRAYSSPSIDFTKTPLLQGMPYAWADVLSPLSPSSSGSGGTPPPTPSP
jgi:hypothetical protein